MTADKAKPPKKEYWRWTEYNWVSPDLNWRDARIVAAGVDVGSVSTQAVIMTDGELYAFASIRTGSDSSGSAFSAISRAMENTGLKLGNIHCTVGTGYGRVNIPFAHKTVTEISCHARGAIFMYGPTVRTVLDMGGQDCKAIRCDGKGRVVSFLMNDKCAAGTGRGMEVFADMLAVPVEEVGEMSLRVDEEPEPVSSTCVVFAKTEAAGLIRAGWSREKVLAAYCSAVARRVAALLERNGVEKDFAITGGIAKNAGVVSRLEKELGLQALKPRHDTQIAGAVGAAVFAGELAGKGRRQISIC
ncbi:MAG: benzoyl-CoA reductase, bzd-type, subunit Q [Peptococcaceae bacterium]|nr:benzoyl-CoA reductase, bzd-type, subunit Q [Peptococcaceae bacterium]